MRILIIYGGYGLSQEAEVSERSGLQVLQICKKAGLDVAGFKLTKNNLGELQSQVKKYDVIFPVLHGEFGEDGQIQKILDDLGAQYVGSGSESSKLCFDKIATKEILKTNNILTPEWVLIKSKRDIEKIKYPVVLKPIKGGSSIGIIIAKSIDDLSKLDITEELLAEEYINGQELTVGVLGDKALPVVEIIPPKDKWFDYENKYNESTQENVPPKYISLDIQQQARQLALKVHKLCDCRHLSRVDMILRNNQLYVLEINTMPGMTEESLYPKSARVAGYPMPKLIIELISSALSGLIFSG